MSDRPYPGVRLALAGIIGLVLGGAGGFAVANRPEPPEEIRIEASALAAHTGDREALLDRPLSDDEKQAILDRILQQEIMVREAARLNLHRKDRDIRKHLTNLMRHVMFTEVPDPTRADLDAFFAENPDRYMLPESVTFEHVFFGEDREAAEALAASARAGGPVPEDAGQIFWLGRRMERYYQTQLLTVLGADFTRALKSIPTDEWAGPVRSGRGWHLVRLEAFHAPTPLPEDERMRRLREDWKKDALTRDFDARIEKMSRNYKIALPKIMPSNVSGTD